MTWFISLFIGLLTAILGCGSALFIATKCVRWYRISSFEGGSGYFVVLMGLFGIVIGMVVGTVAARFAVTGEHVHFLRGLGYAFGSLVSLALVVLAACRLGADLPPEIDGKSLELAIEVRAPRGFTMPVVLDKYGAHVCIDLPGGKRQPQTKLDLDGARQVDGQWIITATVPLETSSSNKYVRTYFNKDIDGFFRLGLRSRPTSKNFEWSPWIESAWNASRPRPDAQDALFMRYKVQVVEPPPPSVLPTQEQLEEQHAVAEQAEFDAMKPDASILAWMKYTEYGTPQDRRDIAVSHIANRSRFVAEITALIEDEDTTTSTKALRLLEHVPNPDTTLCATVANYGRSIASLIGDMNNTPAEQDPHDDMAAEISIRFSAWMVAIESLRKKAGGDFTPELQAILKLGRVRPDSHCMRMDVVRVASYYLHEWAGVEPLPTDPKPRG